MIEYRGRDIPWLPVVQFHKEVVARAEQGFFSLDGRDDQAERWTSLVEFDPPDLAGPWRIERNAIRSRPFQLSFEQGEHEGLFLGGPCYLAWSKTMGGKWLPNWRPLLYREVEMKDDGEEWEIVPKAGKWSITPLLYSLFDRLEVCLDESLDDFAAKLIEKAVAHSRREKTPLHRSIVHSLLLEVPDAEDELCRRIETGKFRVRPTPWVLFAPTNRFSALTRYLMRDYERLETLLEASPERIGGLRLLEDRPVVQDAVETDVLPLVPLNESQKRAVQRVLEEHPLTVISGPPGTGKSQVVVALLLNAWARGKTVLFASNNNKAVDVVRERVERFESEFPIAVRAGAKQKQNIQEVLRRTLNMASLPESRSGASAKAEVLRRRRAELLEQRRVLRETLDSMLPQRIDEARKAALRAYGEYRTTLAKVADKERELKDEQARLRFGTVPVTRIEACLENTRKWLQRMLHFRQQIVRDDQRRIQLDTAIAEKEGLRNQAAEQVGLQTAHGGDWTWLLSGPGPELVSDWQQRIHQLLARPIEQALEPVPWDEEYNRWSSAKAAEAWAEQARRGAEDILRTCAEHAPKLEEIETLSDSVDQRRSRAAEYGVPADVELSTQTLKAWAADYSEYATTERSRFDIVPWSRRSRLRRRLRRYERQLRPGLPLELWTRIGSLNDSGREKLAPVIDAARQWIELRREWRKRQDAINDIEASFRTLRSGIAALGMDDIPTGTDAASWRSLASRCTSLAAVADAAAAAWQRRSAKEAAENELRSIAQQWMTLASGIPIREAWRKGQGAPFDKAIRNLADSPDQEKVAAARTALYTGPLTQLIECWQRARDHEQAARQLRAERNAIPEPRERVEAWWRERPRDACVLDRVTADWPDTRAAEKTLEAVESLCKRWREFIDDVRPKLMEEAKRELEWAVQQLERAVEVLPGGEQQATAIRLCEQIRENPEADWPLSKLNAVFAEFSPDRIKARIDRLEMDLERGAFEDAKAKWLERLREDDEAIRAVDHLERALRRNRGSVDESLHGTFRSVLRAVPIWITTAQASQAIPLEPELFDIVVIDEASQCTLTNLLPLMYRGRTLVVIGDDHQLPAIPTIQESEELALARKYDIEDYLPLVGHASNDVYNAAAESLPRRRADVIMLNEHFRSNPQIIGFSNRHIYLQRLELKKDPSWRKRLPVGSGVHVFAVSGTVHRGPNNRSWVNPRETEEVIKLVQQLRQDEGKTLSLGIVTPFAAQKELLRNQLDQLRLSSDVLVDTAYGFQGDERDVIIFSPVVASGITPSASRWVESPPNLVNVAITRAREALFVVGDIEYCLQQEGILRKLALYCKDIQLLRETSEAELELFSWMVVKGWEPRVHPRVGDVEVDFVLETVGGERIAIEVDGAQHMETPEQDKARDAYLQGRGYSVLRIPAREVLETPFDVVYRIAQMVGSAD